MIKRLFDVTCSLLGLLSLLPIFFIIAVIIKLDSAGPIFYRQERVGQHGRLFKIHKFRSMHVLQARNAAQVTVDNDPRITRVGHFIRKWKLDELAQLIDVWKGQMSLVGPRPEVPKYVELYPDDLRRIILSVKPGITDPASIQFRDENILLAQAEDPELTYQKIILPAKLKLQAEYVRHHSFWNDVRLIIQTVNAVLKRR